MIAMIILFYFFKNQFLDLGLKDYLDLNLSQPILGFPSAITIFMLLINRNGLYVEIVFNDQIILKKRMVFLVLAVLQALALFQ
jgi:hypothetical protein